MSATIILPGSNEYAIAASMQSVPACSWSGRHPQKFIVPFAEVKHGRRVFQLALPLDLELERVDGGWTCQEEMFSLYGFGKTNSEAVYSVFEDFSVLWDEVAMASDDELSEEAQRTKLALLGLVRSVE